MTSPFSISTPKERKEKSQRLSLSLLSPSLCLPGKQAQKVALDPEALAQEVAAVAQQLERQPVGRPEGRVLGRLVARDAEHGGLGRCQGRPRVSDRAHLLGATGRSRGGVEGEDYGLLVLEGGEGDGGAVVSLEDTVVVGLRKKEKNER